MHFRTVAQAVFDKLVTVRVNFEVISNEFDKNYDDRLAFNPAIAKFDGNYS
jgi:hypothetical protein